MTDRIHSLTIVLERDIRDDDVKSVVDAAKMIRGVLTVGSNVTDHNDYVARERARAEFQDKIRDILWQPATHR